MDFETWTRMEHDAMEVIDRFAAAGICVPPATQRGVALTTVERVAYLKNRAMDAMQSEPEDEEEDDEPQEVDVDEEEDEEGMKGLRAIHRTLGQRTRALDATPRSDLEY